MIDHDSDLFHDFLEFSQMSLAMSDFDAEQPICKYLIESQDMDRASKLWLCFLYMAFYDEASMMAVYNETAPFTVPKDLDLPIAKNRRNLWGGRLKKHFEALAEHARHSADWPFHDFDDDPAQNFEKLKKTVKAVWGNGRWATFTTAELIQKMFPELGMVITNIDAKDASGPADGLCRLFKCTKKEVERMDLGLEYAYAALLERGMRPTYTDLDRGVVESILCTFSGTVRGVYYSGRNVDRQQHRIMTVEEEKGIELNQLWIARQKTIDEKFLGELNGWVGIDKERLQHYKKTGEILCIYENR